jgi:hypothetical protein
MRSEESLYCVALTTDDTDPTGLHGFLAELMVSEMPDTVCGFGNSDR